MVGRRLLFYWEGNFSGAMLNFGRVLALDFPGDEKTWDIFIVFLVTRSISISGEGEVIR